ncbi:MAG TPA: hypothetical protein DD420_39615 [Streptomyces sp.]|nr:hypothetical protein [Streptomyces sp.]
MGTLNPGCCGSGENRRSGVGTFGETKAALPGKPTSPPYDSLPSWLGTWACSFPCDDPGGVGWHRTEGVAPPKGTKCAVVATGVVAIGVVAAGVVAAGVVAMGVAPEICCGSVVSEVSWVSWSSGTSSTVTGRGAWRRDSCTKLSWPKPS